MSKIDKLRKVEFSHEDLARLSESEQVLISILSYAISETNALWRAFLCAKHDTDKTAEPVTQAIAIQRHVLLRAWNAKLYELIETLVEFRNTEKNANLKKYITASILRITQNSTEKAPHLALLFRNNSANHISIGTAKKAVKNLSPGADINMYFSEREANSFFPLGEEIFFAGVYNRYLKAKEGDASLEDFDQWLDWNQSATKALIPIMDDFLCSFVFTGEHPVKYSWVELKVDDSLAGSIFDHPMPIFVQDETQ